MRRLRGLVLLLIFPVTLCGCGAGQGVEERAYALTLGMDLEDDGGLRLTVCVPGIGKAEQDGDGEETSPPYLHFSAAGDGWPGALSALRLAIPRTLSLSHIVLLTVSEELASSPLFPILVEQLAETRNLYTATRVLVCPGPAADFVRGEKALIGTRLSSEIEGSMDHYAALGVIPATCLSDLYCTSHSIYGDIAVARGRLLPEADEAEPAAAMLLSPADGMVLETLSPCGYAGSVLFREGRMRLRLDARQTLCLGILSGDVCSFSMRAGGRLADMRRVGRASRRMVLRDGRAALAVSLALRTQEPLPEAARREAERAVARELTDAIRACQREGMDPFGFAESASRAFPTLAAWQAFDWRGAYRDAPLTVRVRIRTG